MFCEVILRQFGLPDNYRKHEFFIRLIDRLVKDGYAEFIDPPSLSKEYSKIQYYQEKTIITIEGYHFIKDGGYQKKKKRKIFKNNFSRISVILLTVGTTVAGAYYLKEMFHPTKTEQRNTTLIQSKDTFQRQEKLILPLDTTKKNDTTVRKAQQHQ